MPTAARRALATPHGAEGAASDYARVEAWLADARLGYRAEDRARGHRSLEEALRLASAEQLRLPFLAERAWIGGVSADRGPGPHVPALLEPDVIGAPPRPGAAGP